jgi:PTS system glucose-specific IIA component
MFGFLKRKKREIFSPVDGQIVDITDVPDEVFSQKMVGDGVAVNPASGIFCAPIDGTISKIFSTNHAFSIRNDKDLEVMVHIGLDTVALEGKGFKRLAEEGARVSTGDPVIEADLAYLSEHAKSTITPVVISESSDVKQIEKQLRIVKQGDVVMVAE